MDKGTWQLALAVVAAVLFFAIVPYWSWKISRKINYRFQYESMVKETVREMVRAEALR